MLIKFRMFILKKLLTALFVPPGLLVVVLLIGAYFLRKRKAQTVFLLFLAAGVYLASIAPVANFLLSPLEGQYAAPGVDDLRTAQAYVVLGGGASDKAVDIFGRGTLSSDSTARLVAAYRLYRLSRKPIIVSGGRAYPSRTPESEIGKRFLVKLGVRSDHIMTETRSRDTQENVIYTKDLCAGKGISKIVLVTSAYHLKRAMFLFTPFFNDVIPCPSDIRTSEDKAGIRDFFPDAASFYATSIALHERLGLLFYKIRFWRKNPANMEAKKPMSQEARSLPASTDCKG